MKVALIGASGKAGSRVLKELLSRGHQVTAIARNPERIEASDGVTVRGVDGTKEDLATALAGHDAIISSARFVDLVPEILVPAVLASGVKRHLIVGGAGSLLHPDGVEEMNHPGFPAVAQANSARGKDLLLALQKTEGLDWTFISPPRFFIAGERTGRYRYGKDHMLMAEDEPTKLSYEDMALEIVDSLEQGKHLRERITIGY
ncbi:NAD(P)-dependent oxidoreductase [Rhizobium alvei]|uniref:NAD(P)H-binding protein n=1 Tax=Rhizobium alvei TaxID=1132659 RepID=A0ABT8YRK5_9HYPH|nr:NAD(P)H-binding protein [Rhizobium alvei]MDO6966364.1 NAD(P)H-binding protein [Rhizobium alvei]